MGEEEQLMVDRLRFSGAFMFLLSALSGWFILGAVRGSFPGDASVVGQAHVTGMLGCFLLLAIAQTFPHLQMGKTSRFLLYRLSILAVFGKWGLTVARAVAGADGVLLTGDQANDAIFILNQIMVVIPGFVCALLWLRGLAPAARRHSGEGE